MSELKYIHDSKEDEINITMKDLVEYIKYVKKLKEKHTSILSQSSSLLRCQ